MVVRSRMALLRQFAPSILHSNAGPRAPSNMRHIRIVCAGLQAPSQSVASDSAAAGEQIIRESLLERLRQREVKDSWYSPGSGGQDQSQAAVSVDVLPTTFEKLGLGEELMSAIDEMKISEPTEVQRLAIPAILDGQNVVMASHTGSGKTLAYLLPLVQALRMDETRTGMSLRPNRPRAVVLCPTRELAEQVLQVAKALSHHAKFRSAMISGGTRRKIQANALNSTLDMVVGTPGRVMLHIEEGNMAFRDIKYVVLDEADTMFDQGFGPELKKFLDPLRNRVSRGGEDFQTILVTATATKAVQKLIDAEFPGIRHLFTSTLHKKVDTSRHHFLRVPGNENKIESLLQVLEPALVKKRRVMVFCNTVPSCRAVDHYLNESDLPCVNYHGEVPADERVENLEKFKNGDSNGRFPALVCTDLAARGLDLVVDHVIMFDFPHNSIDYLHRSGRTARMGAKGKVTSLVTKRDLTLAGRLETAMSKGETLDAVNNKREKLMAAKRYLFKTRQKEALERAASRGQSLDKPGTLTLALQRVKAKRYLTNSFPRGGRKNQVHKVSKAKAATMRARKAKA